MFPAELVPDGHIFAPHHLYIGAIAACLVILTVWDDRVPDPYVALAALMGALFGFQYVWPYYHVAGALMTIAALLAALVAPIRPYWRTVGYRRTALYVMFVLVAIDDVVSHAFGWWTPLDWFWKAHLVGWIT